MTAPLDVKRKQDESLDTYLLRLGDKKELYGLSWVNVAELLNAESNEDFGESKWRKDYALIKKGYALAVKTELDENEILKEAHLKELEAKKEYKKVQSLNVETNKILRERGRTEIFWDQVKDSIERLPVPEFQSDNFYPTHSDKVGILNFADVHFGKVFQSINNSYNEDICKERMQELIYETLEIVSQQGFGHIHIINGADSIEGMSLRVSQLQSISMGFIDQTIKFSKFIASWLNELSKHVKISYHHVPASNHSQIRPFNSSRSEFVSEDLEKVIMNYVHDVLEYNPNVDVPLYEGDIVKLDILGYKVWALHGHQLKGKKNAIRDLSLLHREFIDFLYVAHFHHAGSLTVGEGVDNDIEVINVPSVMGADEYSDSLMTGAKAGALFSVFEKGKGRTIEYKIRLKR